MTILWSAVVEEVTAGSVRQAVKFGALDLNRVKAYTRCGMGQCQGRMCELTAAEIIADAQGKSPREVGYFRSPPTTQTNYFGSAGWIRLSCIIR